MDKGHIVMGLDEAPVRLAQSRDAEAVLALRDELADWLQAQGIDQWRRGDIPPEWIHRWIANGSVYVVELNARIVASVTLFWKDPLIWGDQPDPAGYIHVLIVERALAGHGVGLQLLAWAEGQIVQHGCGVARLDVVRANRKLRAYYERAGYEVVGYRDFPDLDWAAETALYEKRLG